ncbi:hypothetical protein VNI00_003281 [Paramarasmius palmivorus]|uniref:F-box domain-containing protein n=1 Tax=Paramarasmius palmivorus TaxID=297713 RepID=A0AAW0DTG5_9AGAR
MSTDDFMRFCEADMVDKDQRAGKYSENFLPERQRPSQTLTPTIALLDTTFRTLSRSITSSNRQLIIQTLHDAEDNLKECESEIAILLARRERHIRSIQRCQALLTPIHDLPAEILSFIFEILCEENALTPDFAPLPLTLSAVCSRWRQIVVSSPTLWSSLEVNASSWKDESMLARTVQMFMDRSRTKPLKIRLQCYHYPRERAIVDPSLRILVTDSSRWLVMDFSFHTSFAPDWDITKPEDLFEEAPALRSAACECVAEVPELPFEQLTRLTVAFTGESIAGPILQRCQALKQLEISYVQEEDDIGDIVIVPNVEALTLTMSTELTIRLSEIQIIRSRAGDRGMMYHSSNIRLISPFSVFEALPVSDTQILDILTSVPLLQHLFVSDLGEYDQTFGIANQTITSTFLERLAFRTGRPALIPQLRVLALDAHFAGFDAAGLVSMVHSRWNLQNGSSAGDACLQSIDVQLRGDAVEGLPQEFLGLESLKAEKKTMTTQTLQLALSSLDTTPFRNLSESHILDRNLLTQTLHDAENALRSCEVNIAKQLAEREELIRSIKRCKSLLSYIHTMPPEILLSIFAYLCERNELDPRIIPSAMAISFVCSRWRRILLSTDGQRLWSSFRVYFDEWDAKPISLAHIVQSYVDRSGTKPLKVELVWNHYCTARNVIDPTLRILVDNSTRWSEMDFLCNSETMFTGLCYH